MAGQLVVNQLTLGESSTPTQNFALKTNVDGTMKLARKSDASGGDVLTVDANGKVGFSQGTVGGTLTLGTAQNTTSGTSIDFTSIPSWVKRITIMLNGVSLSGSSLPSIQIGSGSVDTSGYAAYGSYTGATNSCAATNSTSMFLTRAGAGAAADLTYGIATLCHMGSNTWAFSFVGGLSSGGSYTVAGGGVKTLSGALDRVRLTTVNGTDTFDAGSVNILYEG